MASIVEGCNAFAAFLGVHCASLHRGNPSLMLSASAYYLMFYSDLHAVEECSSYIPLTAINLVKIEVK